MVNKRRRAVERSRARLGTNKRESGAIKKKVDESRPGLRDEINTVYKYLYAKKGIEGRLCR